MEYIRRAPPSYLDRAPGKLVHLNLLAELPQLLEYLLLVNAASMKSLSSKSSEEAHSYLRSPRAGPQNCHTQKEKNKGTRSRREDTGPSNRETRGPAERV